MAVKVHDTIQGNIRQSDKVNTSLSIQLNSGTATVYNGSAAKSINITPAAIGAATTKIATQSTAGLMSAADKKKLDGLSVKGFAPILLWTNPNPTAEWGTDSSSSTKDVSVSLAGVNWIGIIFKVWHSQSIYSQMLIFPTDSTRTYGVVAGAITENIATRRLTIKKSSNIITFGFGSSNGDNMHYYDGMFGVPYQIYAIG